MLKVTFEIVPHGQETHPDRRVIGTMVIGQLEVDDNNVGTYSSQLLVDHDPKVKNTQVTIDDHWRPDGAFDLVRRCLEEHMGCG